MRDQAGDGAATFQPERMHMEMQRCHPVPFNNNSHLVHQGFIIGH